MSPDSIINFLRHDLEGFLATIIVILAVIVYLIIHLRDSYRAGIIQKLKVGKLPSKEITGKIKSIEYVLGRRRNTFLRFPRRKNGRIIGRFFLMEGVNPLTHKLYIYSSQKYTYDGEKSEGVIGATEKDKENFNDYVSKYIHIGDSVKIFVSINNSNYYYVQDIVKQ